MQPPKITFKDETVHRALIIGNQTYRQPIAGEIPKELPSVARDIVEMKEFYTQLGCEVTVMEEPSAA